MGGDSFRREVHMRKVIIGVGVAAVVAMVSAATVEAQRFGGPGERRPGIGGPRRPGPARMLRRMTQLDLTAEQRTAVRDVLAKSRAEAAPLLKQVREQRHAMRAAIQSGAAPETARANMRTALAEVRKQLMQIRQNTREAVKGVLGAGQAAKAPN
jgi:Spy/CpxP family protein refolding chaperone